MTWHSIFKFIHNFAIRGFSLSTREEMEDEDEDATLIFESHADVRGSVCSAIPPFGDMIRGGQVSAW